MTRKQIEVLSRSAILWTLAVGLAGCEQEDATAEAWVEDLEDSEEDGEGTIEVDLREGDEGPAVVALHRFLTTYGYFPNPTLAEQHSSWRPLVDHAPQDPSFFDKTTREAVEAYQTEMGLEVTGEVDEATRAIMRLPRCGTPEGISREGHDGEKFALLSSTWSDRSVTWGLVDSNGSNLSSSSVRSAVRAAFRTWSDETNLDFGEASPSVADIRLEFIRIAQNHDSDPDNDLLAFAREPRDGGDVFIDEDVTWSTSSSTPSGSVDLESVLLHELGHSLGLHHSTIRNTTMWPSYRGRDHTLHGDDKMAVSVLYDGWELMPGSAVDVATGDNGAIWVVGTDLGIYYWAAGPDEWLRIPGWGNRIAVDNEGHPWVVNSLGEIFRWEGISGLDVADWVRVPGCARDVGAGGGRIWIIGCNTAPGGHTILHRARTGSSWTQVNGGAERISVDMENGLPWVVNVDGFIYRATARSGSNVTWENIPGTAVDVGAGRQRRAGILGGTRLSNGDYRPYAWNEQAAGTSGSPPAPARRQWIQLDGSARTLDVDRDGHPIVINGSNQIWRRTRTF